MNADLRLLLNFEEATVHFKVLREVIIALKLQDLISQGFRGTLMKSHRSRDNGQQQEYFDC